MCGGVVLSNEPFPGMEKGLGLSSSYCFSGAQGRVKFSTLPVLSTYLIDAP